MKKVIALSLISLGSFSATAVAECDNLGQCSNVTIDRLYLEDDGNIYMRTSGNEQLLKPFCDPGNGNYIVLRNLNPSKDHMFSLILMSHKNRSILYLRVKSSATGGCDLDYIVSDIN